ncbi:MAG: DUF5704 domain-containing protein, partial [Bacillota bacterium]
TYFDFANFKSQEDIIDDLMDNFLESIEIHHKGYIDISLIDKDKWVDYVHVITPFSSLTKGMTRLWHEANDGSIWYIDVPLDAHLKNKNLDVKVYHKRYKDERVLKEENYQLSNANPNITLEKMDFELYNYLGYKINKGNLKEDESVSLSMDRFNDEVIVEFYYKEKELKNLGLVKLIASEGKFDVLEGIPSSEYLTGKGRAKKYLVDYKFNKKNIEKSFPIKVTKTYVYTVGKKTKRETFKFDFNIKREANFYKINYFQCHILDLIKIYNESLETGILDMFPKGYIPPNIDIDRYDKNIVALPNYSSVVSAGTVYHSPPSRSSIKSDCLKKAEDTIGDILVKNDLLTFNEKIILDDEEVYKNTKEPENIPEAPLTKEGVFLEKYLKIPNEKRNKIYDSKGEIIYKLLKGKSIDPIDVKDKIIETYVNPVIVHTPVFTKLLFSTIGDKYNQMINGNKEDRSLILGMDTKFKYQTKGEHKDILGYKDRDYQKYILKKEIKFPFDIYYKTTKREKSKLVSKDTWIEVNDEINNIYIPTWVDEGEYIIETKTTPINALDNDLEIVKNANLNLNEYIIKDKVKVRVLGRIFGFKITDIYDYPNWEEVFRIKKGSKTHKDDSYFWVGKKDEYGNKEDNHKYILPISPGSHPKYLNQGSLKLGYKFRFQLNTIGNFFKEDKIVINPKFKYLNKSNNIDSSVKFWTYIQKDLKNHFICLDDKEDLEKYLPTYYLDISDPFIDISDEALNYSSNILNIDLFDLKEKKINIGNLKNIQLNKYLRVFEGNLDELTKEIDQSRVKNSVQRWFGFYKLPNYLYVVDENIDLNEYALKNNGIDFKEEIFKKDGYIIVNFEIQTNKSNTSLGKDLKYNAKLSNMFKIEGFDKTIENFKNKRDINLDYGDTIFYDVYKRK